jgi:hypothetical protein
MNDLSFNGFCHLSLKIQRRVHRANGNAHWFRLPAGISVSSALKWQAALFQNLFQSYFDIKNEELDNNCLPYYMKIQGPSSLVYNSDILPFLFSYPPDVISLQSSTLLVYITYI